MVWDERADSPDAVACRQQDSLLTRKSCPECQKGVSFCVYPLHRSSKIRTFVRSFSGNSVEGCHVSLPVVRQDIAERHEPPKKRQTIHLKIGGTYRTNVVKLSSKSAINPFSDIPRGRLSHRTMENDRNDTAISCMTRCCGGDWGKGTPSPKRLLRSPKVLPHKSKGCRPRVQRLSGTSPKVVVATLGSPPECPSETPSSDILPASFTSGDSRRKP